MNKYSFSQIKIGDVFRHVETGAIYRLLKIIEREHRWGNTKETVYEFMDLTINHPWTLSKKQFMQQLKPAPEPAQILYGNNHATE